MYNYPTVRNKIMDAEGTECSSMSLDPILVVDDEPDMRLALAHALNVNGYSVETASDGNEAVSRFQHERFQMVITDMKMPEMSGLEVLRRVRRISPDIPVIMITAYGTIDNAVDAMKEGASDYILKPFSSDILESAVKKVHTQLNLSPSSKKNGQVRPTTADPKHFVSRDEGVLKMLGIAKDIAPSKATVLIRGESGTGKELLAAYIHEQCSQKESPYIAINCAALPESLAESELFGHEKGSFTGAIRKKIGKFEQANQGTLVLDEISEMPLHLQAKLLRVLQEKEIDPVGGNRVVPVDTRVIAISNVDLKKAVESGKFREDLYYRLNVIPLIIPPLRKRKIDIPPLSQYFLDKFNTRYGKEMTRIADETLELLLKYDWAGKRSGVGKYHRTGSAARQ